MNLENNNSLEPTDSDSPKHQKNTEDMNEAFDEKFKAKFQAFKVPPPPEVWQHIEEEIPLHPGVYRYLSWLTKIAVILVIGMLLTILSDQSKHSPQRASTDTTPQHTIKNIHPNSTPEANVETPNNDFVYEVEKKTSKKTKKNSEEAEIENLLQFILEKDEDITSLSDTNIINNSLQNAEPLDETTNIALADQDLKNTELQIKIPLIIVEGKQEADELIRLYEEKHN